MMFSKKNTVEYSFPNPNLQFSVPPTAQNTSASATETKNTMTERIFPKTKSETCKTFSGWWLNHPFEKYARQNGNLPQIGVKIKNIWNHHLVINMSTTCTKPIPTTFFSLKRGIFWVLSCYPKIITKRRQGQSCCDHPGIQLCFHVKAIGLPTQTAHYLNGFHRSKSP